MELIVYLFVYGITGVAAASIAHHKGRSVPGWFFGGFFLFIVGVVIVACLPNLREERAGRERARQRHRRLAEELKQEKIKSETFRSHARERLDSHDEALGMDTRALEAGSRPALAEKSGVEQRTSACSSCGALLALPPGFEGGRARCKECGATVEIPSPESALIELEAVRPEKAAPPPLADAPDSRQWYYVVNGERRGPVRGADLVEKIETGAFTSSGLVWCEGLEDWVPASEFPEFDIG